MTADQRLVIERAYMAGLDQVTIAALVGKHQSTISRELHPCGVVRHALATRSDCTRERAWLSGEVQREVVPA